MTMNAPLLRALAVAAAMALSAPAWSAAPAAPGAAAPSAAAAIAEARELMRARNYDEALAVLRPLLEGRAVEADALFHFGLAAIGAAERPGVPEDRREALLDQAIAAFHAMLVERPELVRVRLELARAFFLKGEDTLARRNFEQVLAGKPPPAVARNVSRFLAQIRARKRWSVRVGMALAPDSNIGAGSDERIIYIHGLPFRRDQEELTSSGVGVSVWAGGEYQYPLDARRRLRVGGDVWRREYRKDEFDRMTLSAHAGPRRLIGHRSEASLLASARRQWVANEPDHRDLGVRAELRRRLTFRTVATLNASRHERRYDERTHLDGPVTEVSLSGTHALAPTLRAEAGVGWGREQPKTERYRHSRRWGRFGVTAALPLGFTVGASATLRWTSYQGNWSPYVLTGGARRDRTRSGRLSAHNRAFTVAGFSPQVSVVRESRSSNAQLHDYQRTSGELRFVRLF